MGTQNIVEVQLKAISAPRRVYIIALICLYVGIWRALNP